jgi:hypothetical protein
VRPSAWFRGHLRNIQYGGLEVLGCLSYLVVRPSARSRDHLLIYSHVQSEFLVAYVRVWQSTLSRTVVTPVKMMSSEFICVFWLRYASYACGGLLNLLYSLHAYLSSWLLACYRVMVSL